MNWQGVVEMLEARAEWLDREMRNGGNYEHLSARWKECKYIADKIRDIGKAEAKERGAAEVVL